MSKKDKKNIMDDSIKNITEEAMEEAKAPKLDPDEENKPEKVYQIDKKLLRAQYTIDNIWLEIEKAERDLIQEHKPEQIKKIRKRRISRSIDCGFHLRAHN